MVDAFEILEVKSDRDQELIVQLADQDVSSGKNHAKVNFFELCSALILLSDSNVSQKSELFVSLFDTNENFIIGVNELTVLFRCCLRVVNLLSNVQDQKRIEANTIAQVKQLIDGLLQSSRSVNTEGISIRNFMYFVLNSPIILRFLHCYKLFDPSDLEYDFGFGAGFVFHEYYQAELNTAKSYTSETELTFKKGLRGLKDHFKSIEATEASPFECLMENIYLTEPTNLGKVELGSSLHCELRRKHVYGVRTYGTRKNLILTTNNHMLFYTVGNMIISVSLKNYFESEQVESGRESKKQLDVLTLEGLKLAADSNQRIQDFHVTAVSSVDYFYSNGYSKAVSCELSSENNITIWDPDTSAVIACVKNLFPMGVSKVKFSTTGQMVAIVGRVRDDEQFMAVMNVGKIEENPKSIRKDDRLEIVTKIDNEPVLDLCFDSNSKSIYFSSGRSLYNFRIKGAKDVVSLGWGKAVSDIVTCILCPEGAPVLTGCISGHLVEWTSSECKPRKPTKQHEGPINCLELARNNSNSFAYLTGGDDGFIRLWKNDLKLVATINLNELTRPDVKLPEEAPELFDEQEQKAIPQKPGNQSHPLSNDFRYQDVLSLQADRDLIVATTRTGDLFLLQVRVAESRASSTPQKSEPKAQVMKHEVLVKSNSDESVTGAAVSYNSPHLFTIGTNSILNQWDYNTFELVKQKRIHFPGKLLATCLNGTYLAVGCTNGSVLILSTADFAVMFFHAAEKKDITALSFNPSNENLAIGYENGVLELLSSPQKFTMTYAIRSFNMKPIVSLDFSEDNLFLKATFSDARTDFYDVAKGVIVKKTDILHKNVGRLKEERWSQWTSVSGWQNKGIWAEYDSPFDVTGVVRSENKDLLAVWDRFGGVKVYRFPCHQFDAPFLRLAFTGGGICCVKFNYNSTEMFVVGKNDAAIVQYELAFDEFVPRFRDEKAVSGAQEEGKSKYLQPASKAKPDTPSFFSVLPHLFPSKFDPKWSKPVFSGLNLNIIFSSGINVENAYCPLVSINDSTLIYGVGATLVKVSIPSFQASSVKKQYYHFHSRLVSVVAVSNTRRYLATGESRLPTDPPEYPNPRILVHELESELLLSEIQLQENEGCVVMGFNDKDDVIVAVTSSPQSGYKVNLLDWANNCILQAIPCGRGQISSLCFRSDTSFVTVGKNHMVKWTIYGTKLHRANFQAKGTSDYSWDATAAIFAFEKLILFTGDSKGTLTEWRGNSLHSSQAGHKAAIVSMKKTSKEYFFTAGKDGFVLRWSYSGSLQPPAVIFSTKDHYTAAEVESRILSFSPSISNPEVQFILTDKGHLIKATRAQPAVELFKETPTAISAVCLTSSPTTVVICTEDSRVLLFDYVTNELVASKFTIEQSSYYTAITAFDRDLGTEKEGTAVSYLAADRKGHIYLLKRDLERDCKEPGKTNMSTLSNSVSLIEVAPNLKKFIVASNSSNDKILVFELHDKEIRRTEIVNINFRGHVISVDWDRHSQVVLLNSNEGEVKALSVAETKFLNLREVRDLEWATYKSPYSFNAGGLHPSIEGPSDVSAVCTSALFPYIIAGTVRGEVFVESNPCVIHSTRKDILRPHLHSVEKVLLAPCKLYLLTKSADSVYVWQVSSRLVEKEEDNEQDFLANIMSGMKAIIGSPAVAGQGDEKLAEDRQLASFKRYKAESKKPWKRILPLKKPLLTYNPTDIDGYKEDILYYATHERKSKPTLRPSFLTSFGLDTTESCPTLRVFKESPHLLTYCRGFPFVLNARSSQKVRYQGHEDLVTAVALHPSCQVAASSDARSQIHVWESKTGLVLSKFSAPYPGGAVCLSFSENERHLAGLFRYSNNSYICIFDAHLGLTITSVSVGNSPVKAIRYKKKLELVSIGFGHLNIWKLKNGILQGRAIPFDKFSQSLACLELNRFDIVLGTADGFVQVLREQIHSQKSYSELPSLSISCIGISNL